MEISIQFHDIEKSTPPLDTPLLAVWNNYEMTYENRIIPGHYEQITHWAYMPVWVKYEEQD